jgi:site-specific DNA recombinase
MHGIRVLMAKNYIDNLGEEVSKGLREKAEEGLWPSFAPLGYLNIQGPDHSRLIVPDPDRAPLVAKLFEWYATGDYSLKEVGRMARQAGFTFRKSGAPIPTATAHRLLRKRIYTGDFEWKGRVFRGTHPAIVSRELWHQVQDGLDGRATKRPKRRRHQFAFGGLIQCGHCGCSMVGETKKGRYVYYHCTSYRGECPEPYAREEVIERQFAELLEGLSLEPDVLAWVTKALKESQRDEKASTSRRWPASRPSMPSSTSGWRRCTWTSWTAASAPPSTTPSQPSGGPSWSACRPRSRSTARPTGPTSTPASGSWSWPAAPTSCS